MPTITPLIPPLKLVWEGVILAAVIETVCAVKPELSANPICVTWTLTVPVPAGSAAVVSGLVGKVQVKLEIVPARFIHYFPRRLTEISERVKFRLEGLVSETLIDGPVLVAVEMTGVAARLNW